MAADENLATEDFDRPDFDDIPNDLDDLPQTRKIQRWEILVAGKPGLSYAEFNNVAQVEVLSWKFAEMTQPEMITMAARVARQIAGLTRWLKAVKEILKTPAAEWIPLVGETKEVTGDGGWSATYAHRSRTGLDTERIKADMGDAWVAKYSKDTEYYEIRFKAIK